MLVFALALLGGMVAAAVLHELTHAAAVLAVGGHIRRISLRSLDVYWALEEHEPVWKDRVIGLAPLAIGVVLAVVVLAVGAIPEGRAGIVLACAWGVYTLFGGVDDYRTGVSSA